MSKPKSASKLSRDGTPTPSQNYPVQNFSFGFLLDPSIIPSLPPAGGSVGHYELMGRPRAATSTGTNSNIEGERVPPMDQTPRPGRPGLVKRSSSVDNPPDGNKNRAGVGAGQGHGRTWSTSTAETVVQPPRPPVIRRTTSFDLPEEVVSDVGTGAGAALIRTRGVSRGRGHGRTWSDSTITRLDRARLAPPSTRSASVTPPQPAIASLESCIKMNDTPDRGKISRLLITLQALIPPSRAPSPSAPPPQTGFLHPATLIAPLAIILEALVVEREILKDTHTSSAPRLPALRDGSTLQLANEEGELDWRATKAYILAFGAILRGILAYLDHHQHSGPVEELMKTVKVYVGKMKKVFGEIAGMYVDGYGFVKGWWDEAGMKGAAAEVGRWGEIFEASNHLHRFG